jgi:hypothetical protein
MGGPLSQATTMPDPLVPDTAAPLARAAVKPWQRVVLALAAVEFVVLFAPTVAWLFDRWTLSVWQHAHGLLIVAAVSYFIYEELRNHAGAPRSASAWGFVLLVPALVLHALDAGMHTQLLSAAALVLALPGLSFLLLGRTRTRAILFPLAFLAFALPIPLAFTEQMHWQLRQIITAATSPLKWKASRVPYRTKTRAKVMKMLFWMARILDRKTDQMSPASTPMIPATPKESRMLNTMEETWI